MNKASVPSPTSARPLTARKAPANKVDQNKFFKAISRDHDTLGEQSSSNLAGDASRPKRESVKKHSSSPAPRAQPNPGPSNTSSYPAGPGGMSIRPENDDDEYDSDGPPPLVPLNSR
ncbi:hypothetical protein DL93DRAFT_2074619 [Clavulina sp. PMI_390]|nr:hypothetical protein DL93DRAFT_2074619 [Clavulina sp. PMI_390]